MNKTGGAFLAEGADTCVFDPPVACNQLDMRPYMNGGYVSRIVPATEAEVQNQQVVVNAINNLKDRVNNNPALFHIDDFASYFNLAVNQGGCAPVFTDADFAANPNGRICTVLEPRPNKPSLQPLRTGEMQNLVNLITKKQQPLPFKIGNTAPTINDYYAFIPTLHAIAVLNDKYIIHGDAHFSNIAKMGNKIVFADWGRTIVGLPAYQTKFNTRWLLQIDYMKGFLQHVISVEFYNSRPDKSGFIMKFHDLISILPSLVKVGLVTSVRAQYILDLILTCILYVPNDSQVEQYIHPIIQYLFYQQLSDQEKNIIQSIEATKNANMVLSALYYRFPNDKDVLALQFEQAAQQQQQQLAQQQQQQLAQQQQQQLAQQQQQQLAQQQQQQLAQQQYQQQLAQQQQQQLAQQQYQQQLAAQQQQQQLAAQQWRYPRQQQQEPEDIIMADASAEQRQQLAQQQQQQLAQRQYQQQLAQQQYQQQQQQLAQRQYQQQLAQQQYQQQQQLARQPQQNIGFAGMVGFPQQPPQQIFNFRQPIPNQSPQPLSRERIAQLEKEQNDIARFGTNVTLVPMTNRYGFNFRRGFGRNQNKTRRNKLKVKKIKKSKKIYTHKN